MPSHLRFTPQQYAAILGARPLPGLDDARFKEALATALARTDPGLGCYVAGLRSSQARLLREHVEPAPAAPGAEAVALTPGEWRALARACELARLSCGPSVTRDALLRLVVEESPGLAERLAGLPSVRLAMLCYSLKAGVRRAAT
jgi:hypothetical protein